MIPFAKFDLAVTFIATLLFYHVMEDTFSDTSEMLMTVTIFFTLVFIALYIYCLPIIIAYERSHPQYTLIVWINAFGAWSVILWLVAFFWSLYNWEGRQGTPEDDQNP